VPNAGAGTPGAVPLEAALDPTKVLCGDGVYRTASAGGGGWVGKGAYVPATAYAGGDWVTLNGSSYGALLASTGKQPDTNPTYWQLRAQKGEGGTAATIAVGAVTTLAAGAGATVVNSGTAQAVVLDFGIPKGADGTGGSGGSSGSVKSPIFTASNSSLSGWTTVGTVPTVDTDLDTLCP